MIQKLLTKYWLVCHVACVCLFPLIALGKLRYFKFAPLLWLAIAVIEWMVLLPSAQRNETLVDARSRMLKSITWDPFFYIGFALVGIAVAQWLNSGCALTYLPDADVWRMSAPPHAWAPFCVESRAGFSQTSIFFALSIVVIALRTAIGKSPKRMLLQALAILSGGVAVAAVLQTCRVGSSAFEALTTADAMASGSFFGFWQVMAMGLMAEALSRHQKHTALLYFVGIFGNLFGMLFFASTFAVCLYSFLGILLFVYWIVYLGRQTAKKTYFLLVLATLAMSALLVLFLVFIWPDNPLSSKIGNVLSIDEYWKQLMAEKQVRTSAALALWQDHLWVGCGVDGFFHNVGLHLTSQDWVLVKKNQACVLNDSIQYLCEYGVLGAACLLSAVIALLTPLLHRTRNAWLHGKVDVGESSLFLLRVSPITLTGVLAVLSVFAESWISSPFRSAAVLLSWFSVLAVIPAFLPKNVQERLPRQN